MTPDDARRLALALPETSEGAHMNRPDFRVRGKIFATLHPDEHRAVVKLAPEDQRMRVDAEPLVFAPVQGKWGHQGWTNVNLAGCDEATLRGALLAAWSAVAPRTLVSKAAGSVPTASTSQNTA